jgi:hypothetical protein
MALTQTATNQFKTGLMNGSYNFTTDAFKIALYTGSATLNENTSTYTTDNEVTGSGYTAGGRALTVSVTPTTGDSGNIAYISFSNVSWTASLTARGALIYDVTNGNKTVCVLDFGADKTSTTTFEVQFPAATDTSAIIRIA